MRNKTIINLVFFAINVIGYANNFYVAPNGLDTNTGSINNPLATIQRAQELAASGDTVYIRGGLYMMQESQIARYESIWAYVTELDKDGINYFAYQNERPIFDYTNVTPADKRIFAFYITGDNIHIKGIDVTGVQVTITSHTQSECFEINGGSNNTLENINMYDNMAIGVYILRGSNNLILNCDAYRNWDSVSQGGTGGNTDGFGVHVRNGDTGNILRGCRAWLNSDDGFDLINSGEPVIIENCWAFYNGYSSSTGDLNNLSSRGDGNGFKVGGYGAGGTPYYTILQRYAPIPSNTVQFCIAAGNKQSGFYANHHLEGNNWYNNSAYKNKRNYNMLNCEELSSSGYDVDVPGWNHVLANNLGLSATLVELTNIDIPECTLTNNYFDLSVTVNSADFYSLNEDLLMLPRQADGSLPDIDFMKIVPSSDLLDAGADIGFPFEGSAPDLGHNEYNVALSVTDFNNEVEFSNYPNPFVDETKVVFTLDQSDKISLSVYNLLGVKVYDLPEQNFVTGKNSITIKRGSLASGNYILALKGSNNQLVSKIITVQ
ncbi:DUF4990 domain-containing protein [Winogradskyella echinorum]|uniref:DUF4990 domain-containing protein n=1 Tax=Winogradskyella echinorum TaxID=538189 RepID=A0ABR6Y2R4_9FLAO|nr:T9SS type A sorting domain-containing protein [Winogradskyella echinorum]MBC3846545.1 DUF4990 domain-containing protein [Winogradskyella echinorum]MBC5750893.1 DUF4990 domain-containing protein [Winogradskyella echinorum]